VRVCDQNGNLLCEFVRQPHVVCVQKGDILSLCVVNPQIAGCTFASVLVALVLEIAHMLGALDRVLPRNLCTGIAGAIVNQQELPVVIGLGECALDRFLNEPLCVQKDDNHGHQRLVAHCAGPDLTDRLGVSSSFKPITMSLPARIALLRMVVVDGILERSIAEA
jgi:hypothetical protein